MLGFLDLFWLKTKTAKKVYEDFQYEKCPGNGGRRSIKSGMTADGPRHKPNFRLKNPSDVFHLMDLKIH